jgi:hypothetical protein
MRFRRRGREFVVRSEGRPQPERASFRGPPPPPSVGRRAKTSDEVRTALRAPDLGAFVAHRG